MTALFHIDTLRQHALPFALAANFYRALGYSLPLSAASREDSLSRPIASWQIGSDGRLKCSWTMGQAEYLDLSPD